MGIAAQPFSIIPQIWHRDGDPYECIIQSGDESFGVPDSEKQMDHHVTRLTSDSPSYPIAVMLRGGANPRSVIDRQGKTLDDPQTQNMIPMLLLQTYLGDKLTVEGVNHWVKLVERIFHVQNIDSQSFVIRS